MLDKHIQKLENIDNDKIIGAYAVIIMNDGSKALEVMNYKQIVQAWKQGFGYKEGSGTHAKFTDQMAKKTVVNRALKQIINTHADGLTQAADEETEPIDNGRIIEADVATDIEQNANTVVFEPDAAEPKQVEEKPRSAAFVKVKAEAEPAETVSKEVPDMPEWMSPEEA